MNSSSDHPQSCILVSRFLALNKLCFNFPLLPISSHLCHFGCPALHQLFLLLSAATIPAVPPLGDFSCLLLLLPIAGPGSGQPWGMDGKHRRPKLLSTIGPSS
uniref:Uncharacterized protein n=1 Tax=Micrurus spixii TaxID=129469 RepID=A0A2D4LD67_9SAUR